MTTTKRAWKSRRRQHHLLLVHTVCKVWFSRQEAQFSRNFYFGHEFRGPYSGTEIKAKNRKKIRVWFLLLSMQIETEIYLSGWDKLVWYFLCIVVNDKLLLKNKNTLSLTGFPLVGFSRAILLKFLSSMCVNEVLNIYFLSVKDLIYSSVLS